MKIVIIISANAEWHVVKEIFPNLEIKKTPYGESSFIKIKNQNIKLFHSGWGKIASAGAMQYVIDNDKPDVAINLGTCGGFEGLVNQGDVILVEKTFVYDIVEMMGALDVVEYYASTLDLSWLTEPHPFFVRRGVLASADSDLPPNKISYLKSQAAIAGDWETGALAWVAAKNKTRLLILRGVSDLVNENAGEAYDNLSLFEERTRDVMKNLFNQLPSWIDTINLDADERG